MRLSGPAAGASPLSRGVRIGAVAIAALLVAEAAALMLSPAQPGPEAVAVEAGSYFDPERLERAREFRSGQRLIVVGLLAVELAALAALALGWPRASRRILQRLERRPLAGALAAGAGIALALAAVGLPGALWAHERAVDVGLSTQGLGSWLWDRGRSAALAALFVAVGALLLVVLQRRLRRGWWLLGAAVVTGYVVALTFLAPVVVAPIFNRFEPLPAGPLRGDVLQLSARAGVEVDEVLVVDASRRGTTLNAYVDGIGATRRVVLYDNLVAAGEREALRSVVAHELAHVAQRDIGRGILFVALVAPLGMLFVREAGGALAARMGTGPGRVSSIPAYALTISVAAAALTVPGNQLSRQVEERADRMAIELTGDPAALIRLQQVTGERNLSDPDPPGWAQLLLGTHPSKLERIGIAEAYLAERGAGDAVRARDGGIDPPARSGPSIRGGS